MLSCRSVMSAFVFSINSLIPLNSFHLAEASLKQKQNQVTRCIVRFSPQILQ